MKSQSFINHLIPKPKKITKLSKTTGMEFDGIH